MTDQEIFNGIAQKSNAAFNYLYQNHFGMIENLIIKKGGSASDALDVFQEGLIALWMNIQQGKFILMQHLTNTTRKMMSYTIPTKEHRSILKK